MSKIYLRNGFNVQMLFTEQDAYNSISQSLQTLPSYDLTQTEDYEIKLMNCNNLTSKYTPLYCKNTYTFRILR